jgi:hypothetical protein
MLSIEWKVFGENWLRRCYLGWVAYLDAVKKRGKRGDIGVVFLDRREIMDGR